MVIPQPSMPLTQWERSEGAMAVSLTRFASTAAALLALHAVALSADDVADVPSQQIKLEADANLRYFLIGPRANSPAPPAGRGLVIVIPGGDGSAEFHPFVKRIFKNSLPDHFLAAQPVAVKWTANQEIVWPTEKNAVDQMRTSTETFVDALIADVAAKHKLDPKRIFTFSWSSSGPAAYAISLTNPKVAGSFVAMSVFKPQSLPSLEPAKGRNYFLYHSPDDRVCPFRMAKDAEKQLTSHGAKVRFLEYAGGHGWRGGLYDHIRDGIDWLDKNAK
jgi:predicted esterase